MTASFIIVNHNGGREALRCVARIAAAMGRDDEILVVDNASQDGSADQIEREGGGARLIRATENRGYAAGANIGISAARGDVVVVMNADVAPRAGALAELVGAARGDGGLRVVGGGVLNGRGGTSPNCNRALPRPSDILREALFLPPRTARRSAASEGLVATDVVSGAVMAVGRAALDALGPMDEEFFLYNEDVEWCRRAKERGVSVYLAERALFDHAAGGSTRSAEVASAAARMLSDFQYFCEIEGVPVERIRRLWSRRLLLRSWLYGAASAWPGPRRTIYRRRAALSRLLRDRLSRLEWRALDETQNGHPSRIGGLPSDRPPGDPRPTVLHILPDLGYGGAQRIVEWMVTGPLAGRYRFEVLCLRELGEIGSDLERRGVQVHVAGMAGWRSLSEWRRLADVCALLDADIVHAHLLPGDIAARVGFGSRAPLISTKHSVDHWMGWFARIVERLSLLGASDITAFSDAVAEEKSYLGPWGVLPIVIDSPPTVAVAEKPAPLLVEREPVRILMIGRLHRVKRVDLLLECAALLEARMPGTWSVRIVGDGPEEDALRSLSRELGVEPIVEFRGAVADVAGEMDQSDVVVLLSDYEGLGLTVLEALARGRVPLVRSGGGSVEALPGSLSELVIDSDRPEALADRIIELISDRDRCRELVETGREWLSRRPDPSSKLALVYADALGVGGRIRVLHLITRLIVGGAQENTIASVERVDPARYDSRLWIGPETGLEGSLLEDARRRGLAVRVLPRLVRRISPFDDLLITCQLVGLLRKGRFDIVHTHSSKAGIVGRIAARVARVPCVVHTVHGWGFHEHMNPLVRAAYVWIERAMVRITDQLVAVSHRTTRIGLSAGIGREARYTMIRSGIPGESFHPDGESRRRTRSQLGIGEEKVVVGSVGRLSPQKNPADFVELSGRIARRSDRALFIYVGDGPLRDEIAGLAGEAGIADRVRFLGIRRDVPDLLRAFDVFVLTSLWEGLPRVVPQAIATGLPVVVYDVSGIEEAVSEGVNGYLVPPGDVGAMVEHVARLIEDDVLRSRMSEGAAATFGRAFSEDAMISDLEGLYGRLLDARAR